MALDVRPLTPDRFADLAALFEEGGDPKWCWCVYFRFRGRDWSNSTAAENRAALEDLAERPLAPGLVGYADGHAVGWVSLAPREDYERLSHSKILAPVDDTPVWSIVCFVVSRKVRGQGVAAAMLAAAIDFARAHGATTLEAYPVDATGRTGARRRRLPRHARDVRASRVQGRRAPAVEPDDAGPADRQAGARAGAGRSAPGVQLDCRFDPSTSSVAALASSSVRVDTAFAAPLDCRPARMSRAQIHLKGGGSNDDESVPPHPMRCA